MIRKKCYICGKRIWHNELRHYAEHEAAREAEINDNG